MMDYGNGGGSGWMWGFGALLMLGVLLLIGLAIWAVITMTNRAQRQTAGPGGVESAGRERTRQVLDDRYARGEMTTEEYTERRHTLGW
jgi:putative membrane protein